MELDHVNRRTALKLAGVGLIGSIGGVGLAGGNPGNDEAPLEAQLESVTNATKKYRDIETALTQGFRIMGPYVPDMGWHLVNFDRIDRAARRGINIRKPAGLTYNLDRQLGSVEYIVPLDEDAPDVFNDDGEDLVTSEEEGWHPHLAAQHVFADDLEDPPDGGDNSPDAHTLDDLLTPTNWTELGGGLGPMDPDLEPNDNLSADWGLDGTDPNETKTVDFIIEHDDWWTLHAWVHFDNPHGVFASFNHNPDWDPLPAPPHH